MKAACTGIVVAICASMMGSAIGQTTQPIASGYYVQFGESNNTTRNLIPPPAPPTMTGVPPLAAAGTTGMALNPANPALATAHQTAVAQVPQPIPQAAQAQAGVPQPIPMPQLAPQPVPMPQPNAAAQVNVPPLTAPQAALNVQAVPLTPTGEAIPLQTQGAVPTPAAPTPAQAQSPAQPSAPSVAPAALTPSNSQPFPALNPNLPLATPATATNLSLGTGVTAKSLEPSSRQPARLGQLPTMSGLSASSKATTINGLQKSTLVSAQADLSPLIHGCDDCGPECVDCSPKCCVVPWEHYTTVWASALYMRPRNADVAYAVPIDGPISSIPTNPIQVGQVDILDPDYNTGYDIGFNLALTCLTSVALEYMALETSTSNQVDTEAPNVLRSLVSHPSSNSAAADFLAASASLGIDMELIDLSLRHLFVGGDVFAVNYVVGARYARLDQSFRSAFFDNGTERVRSDVDFDGAGLRLGVETQRYACHHCVFFYSNAAASFVAGKFQTHYNQGQTFDPTVVDTSWEAGRVVPILDLELGGGWSTKCGRFKVSAGYVFSAWFNTVKNDDFIQAVQYNNFNGLSDTLTFDGVVGRAEFSF